MKRLLLLVILLTGSTFSHCALLDWINPVVWISCFKTSLFEKNDPSRDLARIAYKAHVDQEYAIISWLRSQEYECKKQVRAWCAEHELCLARALYDSAVNEWEEAEKSLAVAQKNGDPLASNRLVRRKDAFNEKNKAEKELEEKQRMYDEACNCSNSDRARKMCAHSIGYLQRRFEEAQKKYELSKKEFEDTKEQELGRRPDLQLKSMVANKRMNDLNTTLQLRKKELDQLQKPCGLAVNCDGKISYQHDDSYLDRDLYKHVQSALAKETAQPVSFDSCETARCDIENRFSRISASVRPLIGYKEDYYDLLSPAGKALKQAAEQYRVTCDQAPKDEYEDDKKLITQITAFHNAWTGLTMPVDTNRKSALWNISLAYERRLNAKGITVSGPRPMLHTGLDQLKNRVTAGESVYGNTGSSFNVAIQARKKRYSLN